MSTTIQDRLDEAWVAVGRSSRAEVLREVCGRLGTSDRAANRFFTEDQKIPHEFLAAYVCELGISGHWLLTGQGSMFPPAPASATAAMEKIAALVDVWRATAADTVLGKKLTRTREEYADAI